MTDLPVDVRSRADIFAEMDKIAAEVEEQQRKRFAEMDKIAEMTGFKVSGAEESLPKPIEQILSPCLYMKGPPRLKRLMSVLSRAVNM